MNFLQSELRNTATSPDGLGHGGAEHHDLLGMRGLDEDLLDIGPHTGRAEHLVALIDHKILAALQFDGFVLDEVEQAARCGDDDVRGVSLVLQILFVVVHVGAAVVAAESELRLLEILPEPLEVFVDLMGKFTSVARHDAAVLIVVAFLFFELGCVWRVLGSGWRSRKQRSFPCRTWLGTGRRGPPRHRGWPRAGPH
jgi:hypothetical protein